MNCSCCNILYYFGIFLIFLTLTLSLIRFNLHRISNSYKLLILQFLIFLLTATTWPSMIFRPKDYRNLLKPFILLRASGKLLGYEVEIRGKDNIKSGNGCVVIMNHQSTLDLLMIGHIWPLLGRAKIVVKKSLLFYPCLGFVLWLSGFLFINRNKHAKAIDKLNVETVSIQQHNYKLLIFPEGTRRLNETFLPFRKGAFHIAIKSQCPIQPIVISHYHFLRTDSPHITVRNRIIISILPEVPTDVEFKSEDKIDDLKDKCREQMLMEYKKISAEIKNKTE